LRVLKRLLAGVFVVIFVGISSYLIFLNVLNGLKIKGYDYLFLAKEPYDLVIKHAVVLNGTGEKEPFRADIAVRNGYIVGVGFINPKASPVFDAGGLTIIPWPVKIKAGEQIIEHLLSTAYPRYNAEEIFLLTAPYEGLSLAETAYAAKLSEVEMYNRIRLDSDSETKVLIAEIENKTEELSAKEYLARLTGYRAILMGIEDRGTIEDGKMADFYILKTIDYPEEKLLELFRQGFFPEPIYRVQNGIFLK